MSSIALRISESRPAWARGLKLCLFLVLPVGQVAPCVGAWIETYQDELAKWQNTSRPAWARGLKLLYLHLLCFRQSRALRGRVD